MRTRPPPIFLVIFSPLFFILANISTWKKKRVEIPRANFERTWATVPGAFHTTFFRSVLHRVTCLSRVSFLIIFPDAYPDARFAMIRVILSLVIYIAFRVGNFERRDLLRKSFVEDVTKMMEEKSWRKYKSEYVKYRLGWNMPVTC